jgi:glycosyltransferase A (GT-A) superfamily protein (DUF2064 family)
LGTQNIPEILFFAQSGEDFESRFQSVVEQSILEDFYSIVVLGADLPYLPNELISSAFNILNDGKISNPVVLGPASGGGIYLVGINKNFHPSWITEHHLFQGGIEIYQFLRLTGENDLHLDLLPIYGDIDLEEDLISLIIAIKSAKESRNFSGFSFPSYTAEIIEKLGLYVEIGEAHNRKRRLRKINNAKDKN